MTRGASNENLAQMLAGHPNLLHNLDRQRLIQTAVERRETVTAANGALATWTPPESTGRSPKDTYIVRHAASAATIDWDSPNNLPLEPETFDMLFEDALTTLSGKSQLFITDRVVGAVIIRSARQSRVELGPDSPVHGQYVSPAAR